MNNTSTRDLFEGYVCEPEFFDEVFNHQGKPKALYSRVMKWMEDFSAERYKRMNDQAKSSFFDQGVTFNVYKENQASEKIFPFDLFPRIISTKEWEKIEKGVLQRSVALNHFLHDLYHEKHILKDGVVPLDLVSSSENYLQQMDGLDVPGGVYNHISGTDLIKHSDGEYYVLEDNLRCPSGVSYVLSNRLAIKKILSGVFQESRAQPVIDYPEQLLKILRSVCPTGVDDPMSVVITPGIFNSAYYEHAYLAKLMGVELVEGRDLFVENDFVYMKTIYGPVKVDVIYRRIDDGFIDPLEFRPDSALGVPGLFSAYMAGNVTLANAPGTGVADDKAVYTYVPDIIRYYLGEEPILNNVHTYRCEVESERKYVLEHLEEMVVKPVDESGGKGISIGNKLSKSEKEIVKNQINAEPRKYIAQPIMSLSVHATYIEDNESFEPRHVDLRAFTLLGNDYSYVLKGGLTRVALRKGNLIVNSSQGGGSKDTWVLKK